MTTVIQENIAGVRVVKAFAKEQTEIDKFRDHKETYLNSLLNTINYWASRVPRAQFLYGLSTPLVLWLGGHKVIAGEMPLGDLAKVIFYLMAIGHRVGMVGQFTNILQNASASAERVLEILLEPQTVKSGARPLPPGRGEVVFENVGFEYNTSLARPRHLLSLDPAAAGSSAPPVPRPTLREISFKVEPGQTIAVVGPTGSGKTSLINLIPRFYDATVGSVKIDGVDVRELDLTQLRR